MNTPFEKRICYTICICQLTAVLSCVSMVYLTVAVYSPAYRTLHSGFTEDPVMCTTVKNESIINCEVDKNPSWGSCGEWCLSKSSGSCVQIHVDVRWNGSNIKFEDCSTTDVKYCDGINPKMEMKSCIQGECADLHGIYNCSQGSASATGERTGAQCRNLTSVLSCTLTTTDVNKTCNSKTSCADLEGLYECRYGVCAKILPPYKCDKRCISIKTGGKNVMVRQGDVIYTSSCARAIETKTGEEVWPMTTRPATQTPFTTNEVRDPSLPPPLLLMFCTNLNEVPGDKKTLLGQDCFNGTLLEPDHFGNLTNITYILTSHLDATENEKLLDPFGEYAPLEHTLLIKNFTPLYINFEGCVNTLILNECEKFHADYGGDGKDLRSQSRFQCFYSPNVTQIPQDFVVLRFSRMRTILELLIAACVPVTLAIVSCTTLVLCTRIIHVGDDSHFAFQCCGGDAQAALEKENVEAMPL